MVKGTGNVTIDDQVKVVTEGESVYISFGAKHRIENLRKQPMIFIESQTVSIYMRMIFLDIKIFMVELNTKGLIILH